jgi:hypothetical protein
MLSRTAAFGQKRPVNSIRGSMAIWQFTVGLVPRTWAEAEGSLPAMLYDANGYSDMSAAWRHEQLDVDIDDLMSRVLPAAASWSDKIRIWGDEATSDIQVCYEGTAVESVQVRIDTRNSTSDFCSKIVRLARAMDCYLFLPEERSIISADEAALSNAICKSSAARYSADPRAFLESLARRPS